MQALIAFAVGDIFPHVVAAETGPNRPGRPFAVGGRFPHVVAAETGPKRPGRPGLDPGIDPAIHAFRRMGGRRDHKPLLLRPLPLSGAAGAASGGGAAWMAGSIPGSSPGTARTAEAPRRVGCSRPTAIAIRAKMQALIAVAVGMVGERDLRRQMKGQGRACPGLSWPWRSAAAKTRPTSPQPVAKAC